MATRLVVVAFSYEHPDDVRMDTINAIEIDLHPTMCRALSGAFENMVGPHNRLNEFLNSIGMPWNSLTSLDRVIAHQVVNGRNYDSIVSDGAAVQGVADVQLNEGDNGTQHK